MGVGAALLGAAPAQAPSRTHAVSARSVDLILETDVPIEGIVPASFGCPTGRLRSTLEGMEDQGPGPSLEPVSIWVPIRVAIIALVICGAAALAIQLALGAAGVST